MQHQIPRDDGNTDPWVPPHDGSQWMCQHRHRLNYLAALERHNERTFSEALEFIEMWRDEMGSEPVEPLGLGDQEARGPADLLGDLVRIAHGRRTLGSSVAASFKRVASAVGVSDELLGRSVRAALGADRAA